MDGIYVQKKLTPICTKLICQRLLLKLATEYSFTFLNSFYQQTDGCTMGDPIAVIFSDTYMVKLVNGIVVSLKPKFYRRYVDDMFNSRKANTIDVHFQRLNYSHPKNKLAIRLNSKKFLDM